MKIPDVLATFLVVLGVVALFFIISSCTVKIGAQPSEGERCVDKGGSWVISEKTEGRNPDYECQMR